MDIKQYNFFKQLCSLPFIETVWLFGSRARGDHQARADIDLAIACPKAATDDWLTVCNIIDNADTLLKIDCVRFDLLSEQDALKAAILRDGIKMYEKR